MSKNNFPIVLIVILNWKNAPDTIACINSLKESAYPNYEILLIDNASRDGSVQKIHAAFPEIEIIQNKNNLGVAGGRNVGIDCALARTENITTDAPSYVLFLDNDIIVAKDFLSEMVRAAERESRIGVVTSKILYQGDSNRIYAAGGLTHFSQGTNIVRGQNQSDEGQFDTFCDVDYGLGCSFLVEKDVLIKVGKFDTIFGVYFDEDVDWSLRAKQKGYRIVYVPQAIMWHKVSHTTPGTNYWFQKARNHMIILRRYATPAQWLCFFISFPIIVVKALIYQIKNGNIVNIFHIINGFFSSLLLKRKKSGP